MGVLGTFFFFFFFNDGPGLDDTRFEYPFPGHINLELTDTAISLLIK